MKNRILIAVVLFVGAYFMQACNKSTNDKSKNEMDSSMPHMPQNDSMNSGKMQMDNGKMQSMSSMMDKMKDMKMTGDFDLDFANMMIMHHQAAVDMSQVEIVEGTDEKIITMAKNIITAQNAEIGQLQDFIKTYKVPETKIKSDEMHEELAKTMKAMMDKMHTMKMTGNADKDFVMMMIPHHESAVKMAQAELLHGKQPELKKMAQKIISDQNKEIDEFKSWSSKQK